MHFQIVKLSNLQIDTIVTIDTIDTIDTVDTVDAIDAIDTVVAMVTIDASAIFPHFNILTFP